MKRVDILNNLQKLVEELFENRFKDIFQNDKNKRLPANEIENAIFEYPGVLTLPPKDAFQTMEVYGEDEEPENFVEFALWFDDQQSDLILSVTIYECGQFAIEDIRVQ